MISSRVAMPVDSTTGLPVAGAGLEQVGDQQVRRTRPCRNRRRAPVRPPLPDRKGVQENWIFRAEQCSASGARWESGNSHSAAGPVLGAVRQDLRREHAVDLEKLELDRVAAGIGRRIHKGLGAGEVAAVIAGRFGDEERRGMVCFHLTISKERMAKKRLTTDAGPRSHEPCRRRRFHPGRSAQGPRASRRARPRHHRMRKLRLQACPAAAATPKTWNAPIAKIITPARSRPSWRMPARTRPGSQLAQTDRLEIFESPVAAGSPPPAGYRLRSRIFPRDRDAARLAGAWHRTVAPGGGACARAWARTVTEGFFNARKRRRAGPLRRRHISTMCWNMFPIPSHLIALARDLLEPGGVHLRQCSQ